MPCLGTATATNRVLLLPRGRVLLLGFVFAAGGCSDSASLPTAQGPAGSRTEASSVANAAADGTDGAPIRIRPIVDGIPGLALSGRRDDHMISPLPKGRMTVSLCLHLLRVHGLDARFDDPNLTDANAVLTVLTDDRVGAAYFGAPPLTRTRFGVNYLGTGEAADRRRSREEHRDQCLAAFGELGVPLSQPIVVGGERHQLRDVLQDSTANFHLGQEELVWTALAYGLYLPPKRSWRNKFGEETTFDDIVTELLSRDLGASSCGGTHVVYTLTSLYVVDRNHSAILSPLVRSRLKTRLTEYGAAAVETQEPDGSWPIDWDRDLPGYRSPDRWSPDVASPRSRLIVTGHIAEWLLYLPDEFGASSVCLKPAALWLDSQLAAVDEERVASQYCPYSHAACVTRVLSGGTLQAPADRRTSLGSHERPPGPAVVRHRREEER